MLKIRLKKTGRKHQPFYKIVLMENLRKRDGKVCKELGYYDPGRKFIHLEKELIHQALQNGAYPTDTVRHLLNHAFNQGTLYQLV